MNSLRLARSALRARPAVARVPLQRRTYAEAVSDKVSTRPEETGSQLEEDRWLTGDTGID